MGPSRTYLIDLVTIGPVFRNIAGFASGFHWFISHASLETRLLSETFKKRQKKNHYCMSTVSCLCHTGTISLNRSVLIIPQS